MQSTQEQWRAILREQPVLPSPMCGISDFAFRSICREFAGPMAYTQMVSAIGIFHGDRKAFDILDLHREEPRLGMQLFGADPEKLAESARKLQELGPVVLDLNMGCPARKVTGGMGGSALLRHPDLARKIFRAMRAVLTIPFTVKMRWDWEDDAGASLEIARIAEGEGVDGLCLHARTRGEGYSGCADWSRIQRLKETVSIPVVGNGDIRTPTDAVEMMRQTGCDGVMIGRAVIGGPWLLRGALRAVTNGNGGDATPASDCAPDWESRRGVMIRHARFMVESKGEPRGLVQFRKHAAAYLRGIRGVRQLRPKLMKVETVDALEEVLPMHEPEYNAERELRADSLQSRN